MASFWCHFGVITCRSASLAGGQPAGCAGAGEPAGHKKRGPALPPEGAPARTQAAAGRLEAEDGADPAGLFQLRVIADDLYLPAILHGQGHGLLDDVRYLEQRLGR